MVQPRGLTGRERRPGTSSAVTVDAERWRARVGVCILVAPAREGTLADPARKAALEELVPVVYDELRKIARAQLRNERPDHSLQATALVHEAYLRLMNDRRPPWNDERHFYRAAAEAMRRILIEHARKRGRIKRGGDAIRIDLASADLAAEDDLDQLVALDDAFRRLEEQDPRAADVVRLRFYAGLSVEETAKALDLSERTVKREWAFARAWLYDALGGAADARRE